MKAKRYHVQLNLEIDAWDKEDLSISLQEVELIASIVDRRHKRKLDDVPHIKPSVVKHTITAVDEIDMEIDDWEEKDRQSSQWLVDHYSFQADWLGSSLSKRGAKQ